MKRVILRLVAFLLRLVGESFERLNYPVFFACIIDRERVAEISTNANRIRARVVEESARGNGARLVVYQAFHAERVR